MEKKAKLNYKKLIKYLIIALVILIIILAIFFIPKLKNTTTSGNAVSPSNQKGSVIPAITKENLGVVFQNSNLVRDLPKNAEIELKLYNFNTGFRQWEESYTIKKGSVVKGEAENPDAIIILDSKYVPELGDFCNTIRKAN